MNGLRLSLALPGATASQLLDVARWADTWNIATIWIGDPRAQAPNSADSYVTAAAGAIAAVTTDVRIGLFLALRREKQIVRLAEDVAVLDQASGGRVELGLVPQADRAESWTQEVARFLRAWTTWAIPATGETVAVVPGPVQPVVPRVVVGDVAAADALGAGRMLLGGEAASDALVPPRTILVLEPELDDRGVTGWLSTGAHERVLELRERATAAQAHELLLMIPGRLSEADVEALGTVLVPSLRASGRDVRAIATDSWTWLTERRALHAPGRQLDLASDQEK